ncbi:MAG: NAD(P)/FAD-dependent oxidoreductase [Acidimicrobiia bacterium]|nr:NAD(P)/FAD-dependent oxidoreductase [Acidimicrobiia bacterium]
MTDVIVVGAGHNGLICAAYLARAGVDTLLLEARDTVGGCASTVEDLGVRFNICNCDHTMIRAMPVIDELELAAHGLVYLEPEASIVNVFHDDGTPWPFFHHRETMLDALSKLYPSQVDGYRRYLDDALPAARLSVDMAATVPGLASMTRTALRSHPAAWARLLRWSKMSVLDVLGQYFDDWRLIMPAVTIGPTVWGVPPSSPGTGLAALGYAVRHLAKTGRPAGGSGRLTDAVAASFTAAGGRIVTGAQVDRILLSDGGVTGVRLEDGTEHRARAVVAACDPKRVMADWLDTVPTRAQAMVDRWRDYEPGDGYESKIDAVLARPPRYRYANGLAPWMNAGDVATVTSVVSPSPEQCREAHRLRADGLVHERPTMLINVPTILDPAMRSAGGKHVLSLEVLFTPYAHPGGWKTSAEPRRWLDIWGTMIEDDLDSILIDWRSMTPEDYAEQFAMHRGHTPSYAGSPLAALLGRPRELTRYATPIDGLYLCGAGTFPGAGIFGASGRNAAAMVGRRLGTRSVLEAA